MSPAAAPKILALRAKCLGNLLSRLVGHLAKEAHQCGVYFFRGCPRDAVWAVLHDELARAFDELGGAESRSGDGKDAVGISVNHKRGYIDTGQILAEVFVPRSDTRQAGGSRGASTDVPASLHGLFAHTLPQEDVSIVEILEELGEERITVSGHRFLDPSKDAAIHTLRVVARLEQERGTPEMITALLISFEPYFPRYRATSPPPIEKPTRLKSWSLR